MSLALMLKTIGRSFRGSSEHAVSARALTITCRGKTIDREELFRFTHGRFLVNENNAYDRRYIKFDLDRLCAIAASTGGQHSPVHTVVKMEGGFNKALLLRKDDGSEIIAKIPFSIAGPPKYTTASEVAVLEYLHTHTQVPVPKVLAWNCDPTNPVGAEYIMMEKAPGEQLYSVWNDLNDLDQLSIIKQLTKLEGEMTSIRFPASGSLYFCDSMSEDDTYVNLENDAKFCIGPSCEREWYAPDKKRLHNRGPWPTLSAFGTALVERETTLLEGPSKLTDNGAPRGSFDEQMTVLKMAKGVMSRLEKSTLINKLSEPVLWHTDLHMGNIFVSHEGPGTAKIVSIIDWQSIVVAPLFLQARFPALLPVDEDYTCGTTEFPKLPETYHEMSAEEKEYAEFKLKTAKLAKGYEVYSGVENSRGCKALRIPSFLSEFFIRCGQVSGEGTIPLQACLLKISKAWDDVGFVGECPVIFSDADLQKHERDFEEYCDFHRVHDVAIKMLDTDAEGWINPSRDFATKQQQNKELLEEVMRNSNEFNKSPDEIRSIWPFLECS